MSTLKATVRDGHLVLDQPTELPEGTEVELVPVQAWETLDEGDGLDEDDRRRLHAALDDASEDIAAGRVRPAEDVLAELFSP